MWTSREFPEGCRRCRSRARRHTGQGYCSGCYSAAYRAGAVRTRRRQGRVRTRDGVRERWCFDHEGWLVEARFRVVRRRPVELRENVCDSCSAERRRRFYLENRGRILKRNRVRRERLWQAMLAADHASAAAATIRVDAGLVENWLKTWLHERSLSDGAVPSIEESARRFGVDARRLRSVLSGRVETVDFEAAERIARALGREQELYPQLKTGRSGWSSVSEHCLRCGRFERPHYARGYCPRCYQTVSAHRRRGLVAPPPREERWTYAHPDGCARCKSRSRRHAARGLCKRCYGHFARLARRHSVPLTALLDRAGYRRRVRSAVYDRPQRPAAAAPS